MPWNNCTENPKGVSHNHFVVTTSAGVRVLPDMGEFPTREEARSDAERRGGGAEKGRCTRKGKEEKRAREEAGG